MLAMTPLLGLGAIVGLVYLLKDYIIDLVKNAVIIIQLVIESVAIPPMISPYIPDVIAVCMTFVVGVTVVKIIFMRGGQN